VWQQYQARLLYYVHGGSEKARNNSRCSWIWGHSRPKQFFDSEVLRKLRQTLEKISPNNEKRKQQSIPYTPHRKLPFVIIKATTTELKLYRLSIAWIAVYTYLLLLISGVAFMKKKRAITLSTPRSSIKATFLFSNCTNARLLFAGQVNQIYGESSPINLGPLNGIKIVVNCATCFNSELVYKGEQ